MEIGDALPERTHKVDWEDILKFNRYVTGGVDTKNIHTDDEVARKAGLPRAVATGRHPVSFITELMVDHLGMGFITGGEIDVSFVKPIFPGDVLTLSATLKEKSFGRWREDAICSTFRSRTRTAPPSLSAPPALGSPNLHS